MRPWPCTAHPRTKPRVYGVVGMDRETHSRLDPLGLRGATGHRPLPLLLAHPTPASPASLLLLLLFSCLEDFLQISRYPPGPQISSRTTFLTSSRHQLKRHFLNGSYPDSYLELQPSP